MDEQSPNGGGSAGKQGARMSFGATQEALSETPSLSKHNRRASPGPPPALKRKAVANVAKMALTTGDTPGSSFNPLAGIADCYAAQLALRGGIKQTVQNSWAEYNRATEQLATDRLEAEKVRVAQMVTERQSASLKRPFLKLKRLALTQEEAAEEEEDEEEEEEEEAEGAEIRPRRRGSLIPDRKDAPEAPERKPLTMVRFAADERRSSKRLTATKMPDSGPQAGLGAPGLPLYMTWTYVNRNVTTKEEGRQMFYTDETGETVPASDSDEESPDFIGNYIGKTREEEAAVRGVMRRFGRSSVVVKELAAQLQIKPEDTRQIEKEIFREKGTARTDRFTCCLERLNNCFCRRCRIYGCKIHECGQQFPKRETPVPSEAEEDAPEPCGPDCWRTAAAGGANENGTGKAGTEEADNGDDKGQRRQEGEERGWEAMDDDITRFGIQVFGASRPCAIAQLHKGRTCREVERRIQHLQAEMAAQTAPDMEENDEAGPSKGQDADGGATNKGTRLKRYTTAKKKKSQPRHVVKKRLQHDTDHAWPEYTPCNCEGPCDEKTCPCAQAGNFCEKFCGCAKDCNLRFRGCNCKSQCRHRACPCLAAGRECDPDLCKFCAPTCSGEAAPGKECCNMRVRLRQHARIVMGLSSVAGWGAFLQHAVKKNDFLGEYTGEIISQDEADRRGKVYDRVDNSYLFNLNEQSVLDARQFGNKLRFINHSKTNANCYAVILLVDGDHRVGIFAKQDIKPGVELFYDYRYDNDFGPKWAQKH